MTEVDKEAVINDTVEKMRKKNEEIRRRYLEVEEDKKNADTFSQRAISERSSKPESESQKSSVSKPAREKRTVVRNHPPEQSWESSRLSTRKYLTFAEGDGPPPDPGYRFLADDERDEPRVQIKTQAPNEQLNAKIRQDRTPSIKAKSPAWRNKQKYHHQEEGHQRDPKDASWRAERAAIDAARIQRQKTVEGNWRREWDNVKVNKDYDGPPPKSYEYDFGCSSKSPRKFSNNDFFAKENNWRIEGKISLTETNVFKSSKNKCTSTFADETAYCEPGKQRPCSAITPNGNIKRHGYFKPSLSSEDSSSYGTAYKAEGSSEFQSCPVSGFSRPQRMGSFNERTHNKQLHYKSRNSEQFVEQENHPRRPFTSKTSDVTEKKRINAGKPQTTEPIDKNDDDWEDCSDDEEH